MRKTISGFTIVELLVVIVVIGILATVSIVTYSGVTKKARTAQTVSAATTWVKALNLYKIRNGTFPNFPGCLGANYKYNSTNDGTSGVGQCQQNGSNGTTLATTGPNGQTLTAALKPFASGAPTPAFITAVTSSNVWERGIYYYINTSTPASAMIDIVLEGVLSADKCPAIGNLSATSAQTAGDNTICAYTIGVVGSYE